MDFPLPGSPTIAMCTPRRAPIAKALQITVVGQNERSTLLPFAPTSTSAIHGTLAQLADSTRWGLQSLRRTKNSPCSVQVILQLNGTVRKAELSRSLIAIL
jgi:hypothetical protein